MKNLVSVFCFDSCQISSFETFYSISAGGPKNWDSNAIGKIINFKKGLFYFDFYRKLKKQFLGYGQIASVGWSFLPMTHES